VAAEPPFPGTSIEAVAKILGEAMSGTQLTELLAQSRIANTSEQSTKWRRIYENVSRAQTAERTGSALVRFIRAAATPTRFANRAAEYNELRAQLNVTLAFHGLELRDDGRLYRRKAARTLSEAQRRANSLTEKLQERGVHKEVLAFCEAELLQENYFHAVFESMKSVADRLRTMTGVEGDGSSLVDAACALGKRPVPPLAFNLLRNDTERNEHNGLAMLMKGMFGAFRNTTAHIPKIKWEMSEDDALDIMTLASMIHRRLDRAHVTSAAPTSGT
jgi:uncharacterized protein (TIGR02391 family)